MFKIKQFVSSQVCLKCEGCCRFSEPDTIWSPHLLKEEHEKLAKKIRLLPNPKDRNFTLPLRAGAGFICTSFGLQNNKCKIYNLRPFECRLYPFLLNRKDNKVFLAIDLKCPYAGKNLENKKFKDYNHYLVNLCHSPGVIKILKDNPRVIQRYPGVLNLEELKI